jgi:predicted phosphodiesterase
VRYLVISDIHANLQALEAVLAHATPIGYDAVLCLGDLVGYGADPSAVIHRTLALEPVGLIRGNHDKVCAGLEEPTLFNEVAKRSVAWTRRTLSAEETRLLVGLRTGPQRIADDVLICHGSPMDEDQYIFESAEAGLAMQAAEARLCLFGHTHVPAVFATADHPVTGTRDGFQLPSAGPALINVGSVGQPRDGDPRAAYGILDADRHTIQLHRVAYDVKGAQRRIVEAGLPEWLAVRLERGQ